MKLATPLAREVYRRAQQEGWSDEFLASTLGISQAHMRKVFSNRAEFSLRMLSRTAITFGVPISEFILDYLGSLAEPAPLPPPKQGEGNPK